MLFRSSLLWAALVTIASIAPPSVSAQECDLISLLGILPTMDASCQGQVLAIVAQEALQPTWNYAQYCHCYMQVPRITVSTYTCYIFDGANETLFEAWSRCESYPTSVDTTTTSTLSTSLPTLVELLDVYPQNFSTLDAFLTQAGLEEDGTLNSTGIFTVLAPTNGAFTTDFAVVQSVLESLSTNNPEPALRLLGYHIIRGRFTTDDIISGEQVFTDAGDFVVFHKYEENNITVTNSAGNVTARVVLPDIMASNGVVHGIDRVLTPGPIVDSGVLNGCSDPRDVNLLLDHGETRVHTELGTAIANSLEDCVTGGFGCIHDEFEALGYTRNCSNCFEEYAECGLGNCVIECFSSTTSTTCQNCMRNSVCWGQLVACSGVPTSVLFGIESTRNESLIDLLDDFSSQFSTLDSLLQISGLSNSDELRGDGPFTILAPVNAAFQRLGPDAVAQLTSSDDLEAVLGYHLILGKFMTANISDGLQLLTEGGLSVTFSVDDNDVISVSLDGGVAATIVMPDIEGSNGVAHGIDSILLANASTTEAPLTNQCNSSDQVLLADVGEEGLFSNLSTIVPSCIVGGASCVSDRMQDLGYSAQCSSCFGDAVPCILSSCIAVCLGNQSSHPCIQCTMDNCWPRIIECTGASANSTESSTSQSLTSQSFTSQSSSISQSSSTSQSSSSSQSVTSRSSTTSSGSTQGPTSNPGLPTLLELLDIYPDSFSTLDLFLAQAGLEEDGTLDQDGNFTVLAPINQAFATDSAAVAAVLAALSTDPSQGLRLLGYHIIYGRFTTANITNGERVLTDAGDYVVFNVDGSGNVTVTNSAGNVTARVVLPDIMASNGVVHGIDRVLTPGPIVDSGVLNGCSDPSDINLLLGHTEQGVHLQLGELIGENAILCIAGGFNCVRDHFQTLGYTQNCSVCFEEYAECGLGQCVVECVASPTDLLCQTCMRNSLCWPNLVQCAGVPTEILFGLEGTRNESLVDLLDDFSTQFSEIDSLLQSSGLMTDAVLRSAGPFTVFAPVNSAFNQLAPGLLDQISSDPVELLTTLGYHVVQGRILTSNMQNGEQVLTEGGQYLTFLVTDSEIRVSLNGGSEAIIIMPDIEASNGVAHGIDSFLYTPPVVSSTSDPDLPTGACTGQADQFLLQNQGLDGIGTRIASAITQCIIGGPTCVPNNLQQWGLSTQCSNCFGSVIPCVMTNCLFQCIADQTGPACVECGESQCLIPLQSCVGVPFSGSTTNSGGGIRSVPTSTTIPGSAAPPNRISGDDDDSKSSTTTLIVVCVVGVLVVALIVALIMYVMQRKSTSPATSRENFSNPMYSVDPVDNEEGYGDTSSPMSPTYASAEDRLYVGSPSDEVGYLDVGPVDYNDEQHLANVKTLSFENTSTV